LCNITLTDGAGVSDADYIIYITSVTTNCGGSTLAFANFCEMEDDFDRPIAGYINYCPNSITSDRSDDFIFDVTKHEFLHAMGFSASGYRWFRDENGDPRSPRDEFGFLLQNVASNNTVKTVTYTDWETRNGFVNKTVSLIVTPKVVEEGRRHFNCSTLEGVQLEDQGGAGTGSSHWEKRIVESEGMTGVISTHPKFSRLTYALLEDSGWYKMNYSFAEQLVWGRGDGCGYVTGSCGGYIKSQKLKREPIAPFCDYLMRPEDTTESSFGCTIDRSAVSFCNLEERVNITIGFNYAAQEYGPNSRCIEHDGVWTASSDAMGSFTPSFAQTAGCYEYFCSNSQVNIIVLNQTYTCSSPGQVINVNQTTNGVTYTGTLVCPSCVQICYDDFVNCPEAAVLYNNSVVLSSSVSSYGFSNLLVMVQLMMITVLILLYL
jgi:leishmanolysin-like peptidase